jgi:citrate synthase
MRPTREPTTSICYSTKEKIVVRGCDLVEELIGHLTFTEMIILHLTGKRPSKMQTTLLDAVLVTTIEHGLTPSAITARLTFHATPEALQGAVAAGLLGAGSVYLGTMEGCSALLEELVGAPEGIQHRARTIVERFRSQNRAIPGFGHPLHKPADPRTQKLIELATREGVKGDYISALSELGAAADLAYGRHLLINASGAIAAILLEVGLPHNIARGITVISRAAGLVGHILEEVEKPAGRFMWEAVEKAIPYAETGSIEGGL